MRLADTDTAALYLLMRERPEEPIQAFTQAELYRARRKLYRLAAAGRLTNHGGETRGSARWDLVELHSVLGEDRKAGYDTIRSR